MKFMRISSVFFYRDFISLCFTIDMSLDLDNNHIKWQRIMYELNMSTNHNLPYFYEREIWWCKFGLNVGVELNGKGNGFVRPVLILKKFNKESIFAIPITTSTKRRPFSVGIGVITGKQSWALVSQGRMIDTRRMEEKITTLDIETFNKIKTTAQNMLSETVD